MGQTWIKPIITLLSLALLLWLAPVPPIDPWNLLSPKKIATMIFALAVIQAIGLAMFRYLESRTGALLLGFFGGLISSTATTASLATKSKLGADQSSAAQLIFLSSTGAMLFEGLVLVITGVTEIHASHILIFVGPLLTTLGLIVAQYSNHQEQRIDSDTADFQILPLLKLSFFILFVLSISKVCQSLFGQNGLLAITSIASLFEIHGTIIANVQLHESGSVDVEFLCSLLAVSLLASYLSKLFLIWTLGSSNLSRYAIKSTALLLCSLALGWAIAKRLAPL